MSFAIYIILRRDQSLLSSSPSTFKNLCFSRSQHNCIKVRQLNKYQFQWNKHNFVPPAPHDVESMRRNQFSLIKLKYTARKFFRFSLPPNLPCFYSLVGVEAWGERKNYRYGEVSCANFFIARLADIQGMKNTKFGCATLNLRQVFLPSAYTFFSHTLLLILRGWLCTLVYWHFLFCCFCFCR